MDDVILLKTEDGSHTVQLQSTGDTYHSVHGAIQESQHVFIKNGLEYFLTSNRKREIRLLEIGFGTGLNALLTQQTFPEAQIEYTTLEPFPLQEKIFTALNYVGKETLLKLHAAEWNRPLPIAKNFIILKLQTTLERATLPEHFFDVVYFDAFAPNSQPELWTPEVFGKVYQAMDRSSVLATYCAKGQVKRDLKSAGFKVESLPGPPGKREMVRAIKRA